MSYLYRHIRLDKNEPFYIGISYNNDENYNRANTKHKNKHNVFWNNITNKTDYRVEILLDNLSWEEACKKEIEYIKLYGRRDLGLGTLVNLTDGGENPPIQIGDKNPMKKQENKDKISFLRKGIKFSEDHKKKLSDSKKLNNIIPPSRKGIKRSQESINKMLETRKLNKKIIKK